MLPVQVERDEDDDEVDCDGDLNQGPFQYDEIFDWCVFLVAIANMLNEQDHMIREDDRVRNRVHQEDEIDLVLLLSEAGVNVRAKK